jgi:DNA end-binding protein Ku
VVPGIGAVEADDIVKGYEVEKGKYVLLTDEEIDDVKLEAKRSIDLVQFVDADEIDSLYFEKPYFVAPEDEEVAGEAYVVLRDALKETGKIGLGQIVVRGKSNIVALKAAGKGLMIETLRYVDEIQKADQFFADVPDTKPDKELLGLAEELIERKAKPFDPKAFKDPYEVALRELIDAKIEKRAPQEVEETRPSAKVINLMEALKKSVKGGGEPAAKGKKAAAAESATPTKKSAKAKAAKAAKPAKGRRAA